MTKTASSDLSALDTISACNKPFELAILHPVTGLSIGVHVSLVGKDSDIYRGRVRGLANEQLRAQATGRPLGTNAAPLDDMEIKSINALVAATTAWRSDDGGEGVVLLGGEKLAFSPENVRLAYTKILPLRDQVQEAINNLANFMQA